MTQSIKEESESSDHEFSDESGTAITASSSSILDETQWTYSPVLSRSVVSVDDELFNLEQNLERLINYRTGLIHEYQGVKIAFNPIIKMFGIEVLSEMNLLKALNLLYWFFLATRIIVRFDLYLYMALIGSMSTFLMSFGLASEQPYFMIPMIITLFLEFLTGTRQVYYSIEILQDPQMIRFSDYVGLFGRLLLADTSTNNGRIRFLFYVLIKTVWLLMTLGHFMNMFLLLREKTQTLKNLEENIRQAQRDILAASTQIDNVRMQNVRRE